MYSHTIETELAASRQLLLDAANTTEATKAQANAAAQLMADARTAAEPVRLLLDAVVADRMGLLRLSDYEDLSELREVAGSSQIQKELAPARPAHFPYLFPEVFSRPETGFDVLLGNPPWDKLRHEPQQFWVKRDPGLRRLSGEERSRRVEELRRIDPIGVAGSRSGRSGCTGTAWECGQSGIPADGAFRRSISS